MIFIYKKVRSFGGKLCNRYYYLGLIRKNIFQFSAYISNIKNHNLNLAVIRELKAIIALAKKNNQPIFIQFPIISWSRSLFQRPQQFAKAMSELGYLTIYLSPAISPKYSLQQISDNLYVSNACEILKDLEGTVISVYLNYPDSYHLDRYLTQPLFKNNKVFCEHVDHIDEQIHGKLFAKTISQRYKEIKKQDYVLLLGTSRALCEELIKDYPEKNILYLPNGVDLSHFSRNNAPDKSIALPKEIQEALQQKRKIIGFFGAIAPWIWDELLVELAEKRPEFFILMIGSESGDRPPFPHRHNICLTGAINYQDLPFYAKHFDVSIIPFRLGELAKATSPVKLFEYFAIGKPIVVTLDLIECTKFDGVFAASNPTEFIEKVDEAIKYRDNLELQQKYRSYAESNSWEVRARDLDNFINNKQE